MMDSRKNEMRTYEQDLQDLWKLGITKEEFDNVISHIYDKSATEMVVLAKAIKSTDVNIHPILQRAFERVLAMRQTERQEAYNIYY